jgi:hypothetical protein
MPRLSIVTFALDIHSLTTFQQKTSPCFGTLSPLAPFWANLFLHRTCSGLLARNSPLSVPTLLSTQE